MVGERARVTLTEDGKWLNVRAGPGIEHDLVGRMAPLEDFLVLDGARCGGPYTWFQVDYRGTVGWVAEGIEGQYFAEPLAAGVGAAKFSFTSLHSCDKTGRLICRGRSRREFVLGASLCKGRR